MPAARRAGRRGGARRRRHRQSARQQMGRRRWWRGSQSARVARARRQRATAAAALCSHSAARAGGDGWSISTGGALAGGFKACVAPASEGTQGACREPRYGATTCTATGRAEARREATTCAHDRTGQGGAPAREQEALTEPAAVSGDLHRRVRADTARREACGGTDEHGACKHGACKSQSHAGYLVKRSS